MAERWSVAVGAVGCAACLVQAVERLDVAAHAAAETCSHSRSCFLLLLLDVEQVCLASSGLRHQVLEWHEAQVLLLDSFHVHRVEVLSLDLVGQLGLVLEVDSTEGHTTLELLLHLLEVNELGVVPDLVWHLGVVAGLPLVAVELLP